jgi:hypothetical protein
MRRRLPPILALILAVSALTAPVVAGWYLWCDWVPDGITRRLPGATEAEVQGLLGEPNGWPARDGCRWRYRQPYRLAEFRVDFDDDGRVVSWSYDR